MKKRKGVALLEYILVISILSMMAIYALSTENMLKAMISSKINIANGADTVELNLPSPTPPAPTVIYNPMDP